MADEEGEAGTATGAEVQPWIPFEDRRRARGRKKEAVLRMAVRLFLENGVHRTSLAEVAAALNITKPALYNYFRSKDEILDAVVARRLDDTRAMLRAWEAQGADPVDWRIRD